MDLVLFWILGWLATSVLGMLVGANRGRAFEGFGVTLLFGPLGLLFAATQPLSRSALVARERLRREALAEIDGPPVE